jgi:hypothetical protein
VSTIGIEEATAIGAQILDDFQCSDRSLRDDLARAFKRRDNYIMVEVHGNSLPNKQQRSHKRTWQQNPEQAAGKVDPEVSQRCAGFSCQPSYEGNAYGQSRGPGQEILQAKTYHLTEIAHGVFARIGLPGRSC